MTTDLLPVAAAEVTEQNDALAAAATVWATISIIDELTLQRPGQALCSATYARINRGLREIGFTKTELYEHITSAIDRGDWAALGIARGDPER